MIVSLNWLKKFVGIDIPVEELVTLIGARLVEIEEVVHIGAKYEEALVVHVVEAEKLEGSDHLSLTKIDDGGVAKNVDRDENGLVQVVCGAPNVAAGQLVVWLPPGATVPASFSAKEPFILTKKELVGKISNGMLASAKELDLFDEHEGILELDTEIKPGTLFAEAYELDDYLLDIENKSLTHRPDCFGIIGFAREVAAITGKQFKTPDWLLNLNPDFPKPVGDEVDLKVKVDDKSLSSRYEAIVVSGADGSKKSPLQVQTYLARVGVRPINAVVDVTNYLMILTGQPLHAFDYDKLLSVGGSADIHVRSASEGEELALLDGRIIKMTPDDIVISAGKTAVGLAGAMGGANTEIDENTKNIIIESASFNLFNLRATQFRHGIFSEAITRFTKGQSPDQTAPVLLNAVNLMGEWAEAKVVSDVADDYPLKNEPVKIEFTSHQINDILGSNYDYHQVMNVLRGSEFEVSELENSLELTVPYWRNDVHNVEDVAEEVGRLEGFDNIEPTLPKRDFVATRPTDFDGFKTMLRKVLVRSGADEVLTYSFVHGNVLDKAGLDIKNSYQIANSISPDLQYYRQSLTPSLLDLVHPNIKQGFDKFALFEINKTHQKSVGLTEEKVPIENDMLAFVFASKGEQFGAAFYQAKKFIDYLAQSIRVELKYESVDDGTTLTLPFEFKRSAFIKDENGSLIGVVGEYKKSVGKGFKLPEYTAGFELDLRALFSAFQKRSNKYSPISRFPSSERDICFQVSSNVNYGTILNNIAIALQSISGECTVSPIDIYQPEMGQTKNITVRIKMTAFDHTLTGDEMTAIVDKVASSVIKATNARVI